MTVATVLLVTCVLLLAFVQFRLIVRVDRLRRDLDESRRP